MREDHLTTYLNDHLAGAVAGSELIDHLVRSHEGKPPEPVLAGLRDDILSDRQELESLMHELGSSQSRSRKGFAWLSEKMTELKLRLDDPRGGPLRLLEALDALASGIDGKRALWTALAAAAEADPRLGGVDYRRLEERALDQRRRVEQVRLEAARAALSPAG